MPRDDSPPTRNPVFDGVRAIAVLWMIAFHTVWLAGFRTGVDARQLATVSHLARLRAFARGDLGVDLFFVLSGALIGGMLVDEIDATGRIDLGRFYARRLRRIAPAYTLVMALTYATSSDASRAWCWANVIAINNYVPFDREFMTWSWSLAIELQFYLVAPLAIVMARRALVPRARIASLIALLAAAVAIRYGAAHAAGLHLPIAGHPRIDAPQFSRYFDRLYQPTHARFGPIVVGIVAGVAMRSPAVRAWCQLRPSATRALSLAAVATLLAVVFAPAFDLRARWPGALGDAYLASYPVLFALAAGYLVLVVNVAPELLPPLHRLLAARAWNWIARLSYGAYLIHPIVIGAVFFDEPGRMPAPRVLALAWVAFVAVSFALAAAIHFAIERPLGAAPR